MVGELPKTTGCGEGSRCEPFSGELFLRFRNEFDIKLFSATRVRWSACGLFLLWALLAMGSFCCGVLAGSCWCLVNLGCFTFWFWAFWLRKIVEILWVSDGRKSDESNFHFKFARPY